MSFGDWDDEDVNTQEGDGTGTPEDSLVYGSVNEFYRDYLRHIYSRKINASSRKWNPEWWRVDEAVVRLESLWRAWEFLRKDASTGTSVWFRDHADHHMKVLMDPDGPFGDSETKTKFGEPLPHTEPPEGLFPDIRQ